MASEYIKYLTKDIKQEEPPPPPEGKDKIKNWFYYNKWFIVIGIVTLIVVANFIKTALHIGETLPDVEIAYVGSVALPDEVISEMEKQLSLIVPDGNDDGKGALRINRYAFPKDAEKDNTLSAVAMSSNIRLTGDFESRTSFLILMEDPVAFERDYQILAMPDGTLPESEEDSILHPELYSIPWKDCPALAALTAPGGALDALEGMTPELIGYLEGLSVGRRGFWMDQKPLHPESCEGFWEALRGIR